MATRKGDVYAFKEDSCLKFLNENTKPGDYVFVYPYYPMYYFLADVRNPTRYSILMYNINTELQFAEVIDDLEEKEVKYVLWDTMINGQKLAKWFPEYKHPVRENQVIENYLEKNYWILTIKNGFRIMQRKS
jgi:hypothetical protein